MDIVSNVLHGGPGPVIGGSAPTLTTGGTPDLSELLQEVEQIVASELTGSQAHQGGLGGLGQPVTPEGLKLAGGPHPSPRIGTVVTPQQAAKPFPTPSGSPADPTAASPGNPAASQKPCAASPDPTMAQFATQMPNDQTKRPPGDNRTAQQIIDDNPLLKNLGNQGGIKDQLNKFVGGDMYNNPDQAYKAAALLTYIKSSGNSQGDSRSSSVVGDGRIDGYTKDGDARHGTEAGLLQDVVGGGGHPGGGWAHLAQTGHQLDQTSDTHVNADGTNKDNLQWGLEQAGKYIGAFFEGAGKGILDIITKGRFNPVAAFGTMVKDIGESEAKTAIKNSGLSDKAKKTADQVFNGIDSII